jgi:hypothetical protein
MKNQWLFGDAKVSFIVKLTCGWISNLKSRGVALAVRAMHTAQNFTRGDFKKKATREKSRIAFMFTENLSGDHRVIKARLLE